MWAGKEERKPKAELEIGIRTAAEGRLTAARDEYRLALSNSSMLSADNRALVLRAIADLNEKLPAK